MMSKIRCHIFHNKALLYVLKLNKIGDSQTLASRVAVENQHITWKQKRNALQKNNKFLQILIFHQQFYTNYQDMDPEVEKFAFMVDVSGSTGGSDNYWKTVGDVLSLHANNISDYYEWDSGIKKITKKEMEVQIEKKHGKGGTSPEVVAKEIIAKQIRKVILITDGQVGDGSVKECDRILAEYKFTKTICYIIASSPYGALNMSVTCPFTRMCDNEVWEKDSNSPLKKLVQYTPEDYKILDTLDDITLENFEANFDKIEGLIIALNMGKEGNIPLKNQLVVMKNRMVKELSKKMAKEGELDINKEMRMHLEKDNFDGAMEVAKKFTKEYFSDSMTTDLEKNISHLINLCGDLRGKYNINQIKSNKMAYAQDAKEGKIDKEVEAIDISKNLIECPIIMDEDVPQILIDEGEPILLGLEKFVVDDIAACPLRILNYPEVKAKLKSRLSNFMGVKYGDKLLKNPFTQNKLLGAIPLGCHKSHITVGNYTIARMFSDGKILGNLNMFFAAIWYIIKEKEIEYLKDIEVNATEHLIFRLKNSKTMASLCGLAQFVTTELNSDLAVWYCVNSGYLNQPTDRDTFRFHVFNMVPLIDICKALGYPIEKGVYDHLARSKSFLGTLSWFKKLNNTEKASFKESIRCLYQNSIEIDAGKIDGVISNLETVVKFVPIDGQANKDQIEKIIATFPKEIRKLPIDEIVHIGKLMDAQKSAADVFIDYNFKADQLPVGKVNWPFGLKANNEFKLNESEICPLTLRLKSRYGNKEWEEYIEDKIHIPAGQLFKGRKYMEEFLIKYKRLPNNKEELITFYYNRYVIGGKKDTLPFLTEIWADEMVEEYTRVLEVNKITIEQALQILEQSRPRLTRVALENNGQIPEGVNTESKINMPDIIIVGVEKQE